MKGFFLLTFFLSISYLYPGNINGNHAPAEHGMVNDEFASGIPRPYYRAGEDVSFAFSAAYTFWVPYMDALNIAYSNAPDFSVYDLEVGNVIQPITSGKSGFQIQAEKYLHFDDWRWCIGYMWFYNPNSLSDKSYEMPFVYKSPWIESSFLDLADVSSSFSNQFNSLKGTLDRSLALSHNFNFTPFIGIIGAWETSRLNAEIAIQRTYDDFEVLGMRNTMYWWCIGPYSALELSCRFFKGVSLFLKTGYSINLAKRDVYQFQNNGEYDTPNVRVPIQDFQDHVWAVEPMCSGQLGMKLDYSIKRCAFFFDISWELQTWFRHMGFLPANDRMGLRGNYSMQGLTASFGFVL